MQYVIGIGEYAISNDVNDTIKTFALSSCVALTAYSPVRKVLGMVHIALPGTGTDYIEGQPCYYADRGVPLIIEKMCSVYGCCEGELEFRLYGGARPVKGRDVFRIGEKNTETVKTILAMHQKALEEEETGGVFSRTVEADVATGNTRIDRRPIII